MDLIRIEGIEFYAYHGASDEEQQVGHRYEVDLLLELPLHLPAQTDRLEETVSYSQVARLVVEVGTRSRYHLMEALAEHLAQQILEAYPKVQRVTVRLSKRLPPAKVIVERAGVEITRRR